MPGDAGGRLAAARNTGMDWDPKNLSAFGFLCASGQADGVTTSITLAERNGGRRAVRRLVNERELLFRFSPLHIAVAGSQRIVRDSRMPAEPLAVVRALLEAGADPNAKDVAGYSVIALCGDISTGATLAILAMVASFGGDVDARDRFGMMPLGTAVMARSADMVSALLEAGATPTLEDLSNRDVTDEERRRHPNALSPRYMPITPWTLAAPFPSIQRLLAAAIQREAESVVFRCDREGCDSTDTKPCARCHRAWYCGPSQRATQNGPVRASRPFVGDRFRAQVTRARNNAGRRTRAPAASRARSSRASLSRTTRRAARRSGSSAARSGRVAAAGPASRT